MCPHLAYFPPAASMLRSPRESPHIIRYALLFGLLFINVPRPTPYCFSDTLFRRSTKTSEISFGFLADSQTKIYQDLEAMLGSSLGFLPPLTVVQPRIYLTRIQRYDSPPSAHLSSNKLVKLKQSRHQNTLAVFGKSVLCPTGRRKYSSGRKRKEQPTLSNLDFIFLYLCFWQLHL